MKILIGNYSDAPLTLQTSGGSTRTLPPLGFGARATRDYSGYELGANEILILRGCGSVRVSNHGDKDLIAQSGTSHRALAPMGFAARLRRDAVEYNLAHDTLILRCRGAKDPEGVEIRSSV